MKLVGLRGGVRHALSSIQTPLPGIEGDIYANTYCKKRFSEEGSSYSEGQPTCRRCIKKLARRQLEGTRRGI